jgi:hypothetical protein
MSARPASHPTHVRIAGGAVTAFEQRYLSDGTAVRICRLDEDHRTPDERQRVVLAAELGDDRRVGCVVFNRIYGQRAEIVLEAGQDFWHLGLPELLIAHLCARAARAGICTFLAFLPVSDEPMRTLLREQFDAQETRDGASITAEFKTALPAAHASRTRAIITHAPA